MRLADLDKYEVINGRINIPCDECGVERNLEYQNFKNKIMRQGTGPSNCKDCNVKLAKKGFFL